MARDKTIKFLRTTKSNLDTQKNANNLLAGEPYLITDENRIAVGTAVNAYSDMAKKSEVDAKKTDNVSATSKILGRKTAGSGAIEELTVDEVLAFLSDNTTNDVSISKHGLVPKAPNDTTKFLRGDGTWNVPSGGGSLTTVFSKRTSNFTTHSTSYVDALTCNLTANKNYFLHFCLRLYAVPNGSNPDYTMISLRNTAQTYMYGKVGTYAYLNAYYFPYPTYQNVNNNEIFTGSTPGEAAAYRSYLMEFWGVIEIGSSNASLKAQIRSAGGYSQAQLMTGSFFHAIQLN